jgi:uncharacterized protein
MDTIVATAFWRRLDTEGHDACRLIRKSDGWRMEGSATFDHQGKLCLLDYAVDCDAGWRTQSASVNGSVGFERLTFNIEATPGSQWLLNGVVQPKAAGLIDLDLGFTPATNLIAIRRLALRQGFEVPAPAAYYLEFTLELGIVEQTYRRTAPDKLHYRSPAYDYEETLTVSEIGFVSDYPGLWSGSVAIA